MKKKVTMWMAALTLMVSACGGNGGNEAGNAGSERPEAFDEMFAHPQRATNLHLRVEKVGPCIAVVQSCVQNLNHTPISSLQLIERQHLVFPNIVKQLFHD